jgi:aspartyl-tRNA(Asn)/glutamyl-tRNA(Gln) amidotransferase subunit C
MDLSAADVMHVAKLSRLGLSEEEAEKFTGELGDILSYVELLSEVDTEGVEETASVTGTSNVSRSDEVTCEDRREDMLGMSPLEKRSGQVRVDNII